MSGSAVHVHDERVSDTTHGPPVGVLQHAGGVDRDVAVRIAENREDIGGRHGDDPVNLNAFAYRTILPRM